MFEIKFNFTILGADNDETLLSLSVLLKMLSELNKSGINFVECESHCFDSEPMCLHITGDESKIREVLTIWSPDLSSDEEWEECVKSSNY